MTRKTQAGDTDLDRDAVAAGKKDADRDARGRMAHALRWAAMKVPPLRHLVQQRDDLEAALEAAHRQNALQRKKLRRLRNERTRMTAEIALASSPVESDGRYDYLFVITYGRSGSTLLQGILCSIPGYLIRGENRQAVYHLFKHYETCLAHKEHADRGRGLTPRDPWFGMEEYPEELALGELRSLVVRTLLRPGPADRVIGFKEIRWNQGDLPEYVAFLQRLFPGARFIFNSRNLADVAQSRWWAKSEKSSTKLAKIEARHARLADELGESAYRVHYDDYVADPSSLEGLFEWLGEDFDVEAVRSIMAVTHSYNPVRVKPS